MQITHKIEFKPNKIQITQLRQACGCARFAYNWGLTRWQQLYQEHKKDPNKPKPKALSVKKEFNSIKESSFPWIYDSPKDANQQAFTNLNNAFSRFFKKLSKYPRLKKKKTNQSFYISNDKFKISGKILILPKIGKVKLTEKLRFNGKIMSATVSNKADKWFIAITVDTEVKKEKQLINDVVGVDLGLTHFATLSTGNTFDSPKALRKNEKKLKRKQRQHSKKVKGSNNRRKSAIKLAKLHYKIVCKRHDFLHKLSKKICHENQVICLENLKVQNMLKNHKLAKSISDAGWYEFRRQVQYKSQIYDNDVVIADTFYASSKTCSNCGCKKKELKLSERLFVCDDCNFEIDRDLNAAINLSRLGHNRIYACGHLTSVNSELELIS